mmetsp:Transcript_14086/g.33213  ORF Transcript_14086/g.33213 Transcript_14086/m.33213 type:complete len:403 (+) Transcript_14086:829-2037(+)
MMSGTALMPLALTFSAASKTALACITVISGCWMPRRQPRSPSMGFTSESARILASTASVVTFSSFAMLAITSGISAWGRNSWSGGSRRRTVTGRPSMAVKMPSKSLRWKGSSFASASSRPVRSSAMIICRTVRMRSSVAKNMCSVRTSPMPSAPLRRAVATSSGVSAFPNTFRSRRSSAHAKKLASSLLKEAGLSSCLPWMISPEEPLMEIQSPSRNTLPPSVICLASSSTNMSVQPHTQGLPHPRATTAACDVIPPRCVRMPLAACMPPMSSAHVSVRTSSESLPSRFNARASSEWKTSCPTAAPGEAGSPDPITSSLYLLANCGWSIWSTCSGLTSCRQSSLEISPSWNISTAMRMAAGPVRFPLRHCSMKRMPSWMVNSMSCMSLKWRSSVSTFFASSR